MISIDAKILQERLNELAEVFEKKPIGEKGLTVWFNVLREFPTERVCGILLAWPKSHAKFPAPSEVWKVVNDIGIKERETKAVQEARAPAFHPGVGGAKAEEFIAKMRKMLKSPAWSPREHWERVLENSERGSIGHTYASEALKRIGARSLREPGEDDEAIAA